MMPRSLSSISAQRDRGYCWASGGDANEIRVDYKLIGIPKMQQYALRPKVSELILMQ
jgi:hypothetical protein